MHTAPAGSSGLGDSNGGSSNGTTTPVESSSGSNTGAIAGGVVGGVVALAGIAAIVWFLRHKKKRNAQSPAEGHVPGHVDNMQDYASPVQGYAAAPQGHGHLQDVKFQYPGHPQIHEAGGDDYRQEMDGTPGVAPVELDGGDLPSRRRN